MLTFSQLSNAALPVACVVLGAFLALRGLAYWERATRGPRR
jgi:predicted permease